MLLVLLVQLNWIHGHTQNHTGSSKNSSANEYMHQSSHEELIKNL